MPCNRRHPNGFTLIELMIAVAIVAILAAIAYPSYSEQVKKSKRADAKTALLDDAQFLERNYTQFNTYNLCDCNGDGSAAAGETCGSCLPAAKSPASGTKLYDISLTSATQSYTLTATPTAGASMAGDACANLTLNQLGVKGLSGTPSRSVEDCWGR